MALGARIGAILGSKLGAMIGSRGAGTVTVTNTTMTAVLDDSADPTPAGANVNITLVVTNTGAVDATTVSAAVTLDASLTFVSASGSGWTCNAVGQVVTCTRATMVVGASPTITITVTAGNTAVTASTSVSVTAANVTAPATDTETTGVARPIQTVTLVDSADPTPAGANFTYAMVLTNAGTGVINSSSVVITLDASLTYVSAAGTGWTCGAVGQVVTCTRATVAEGAAPTVTITVTAGNSSVTASSIASASAANAATASSGAQTTGVVRPTMTAVLNDSADPVINGKNFNITLDLTNNGTGTINNASATVTLDANLTWVSSSGMTGWTLGHSGQTVTATKTSFAQGAATQLVIAVTAAQASTVSASTSVTVTADNAANATDTETTALNFITRDATSGKYLPSTDTEWTNFIAYNGLGISNPTSLWTMQAASGNEASVIGGGYTLTANGSPGYRTAITGWSRTGQLFADGGSDRFSAALGTGTNPNTTSSFMLGLCRMPAAPSVADRAFWGQAINSAANGLRVTHKLTTGKVYLRVFGVSSADSASDHSSGVHLFGTKNDRAGSLAMLYTDLDKVTGTYSASVADQAKGWGSAATGGGAEAPMWSAEWTGAAAVAMTDAAVKALYQAIGYTITWS